LVFTNQENPYAMEAIGNQILDAYRGAPSRDWIALAGEFAKRRGDEARQVEANSGKTAAIAPPLPLHLINYGSY
jgi:hypothetical protein